MAKVSFSLPDPLASLVLTVCRELGIENNNNLSLCVKHLLMNCLRKAITAQLAR